MKYALYYNGDFLEVIDVKSLNEANDIAAKLEFAFCQIDIRPRVEVRELKDEKKKRNKK